MTENEKLLHSIAKKQAEDISIIRVNQEKDNGDIRVSLARIEFKLKSLDEINKKCDNNEERILLLETASGRKALTAWKQVLGFLLGIAAVIITSIITTNLIK